MALRYGCREASTTHNQDVMLQLYLIFKYLVTVPVYLEAWQPFAVEMRRLANKFMLSTWWFWEQFIPLPYKGQVGTGEGSVMKELNTAGEVVAFLKLSESDYMFATSQVKSGVVIS